MCPSGVDEVPRLAVGMGEASPHPKKEDVVVTKWVELYLKHFYAAQKKTFMAILYIRQ